MGCILSRLFSVRGREGRGAGELGVVVGGWENRIWVSTPVTWRSGRIGEWTWLTLNMKKRKTLFGQLGRQTLRIISQTTVVDLSNVRCYIFYNIDVLFNTNYKFSILPINNTFVVALSQLLNTFSKRRSLIPITLHSLFISKFREMLSKLVFLLDNPRLLHYHKCATDIFSYSFFSISLSQLG